MANAITNFFISSPPFIQIFESMISTSASRVPPIVLSEWLKKLLKIKQPLKVSSASDMALMMALYSFKPSP
jgi:hypothetical protein